MVIFIIMVNYRHYDAMIQYEKNNEDTMMIVISDVWLDQPKVIGLWL